MLQNPCKTLGEILATKFPLGGGLTISSQWPNLCNNYFQLKVQFRVTFLQDIYFLRRAIL